MGDQTPEEGFEHRVVGLERAADQRACAAWGDVPTRVGFAHRQRRDLDPCELGKGLPGGIANKAAAHGIILPEVEAVWFSMVTL